MRGKLILVAGVAAGYVLGARAGRERYEQIASAAGRFWQSKPVQRQVHQVEDFAKDKAPEVVDFVSGNVKKAVTRKGRGSRSTARGSASGGAGGTSSSTTTPGTTDSTTPSV